MANILFKYYLLPQHILNSHKMKKIVWPSTPRNLN